MAQQRQEVEAAAAALVAASAPSAGTAAVAAASTAPGPTLNEKQALALRLVVEHAAGLDGCHAERDALVQRAAGPLPCPPQPLRLVMTGTAGTGKTVVIREMVRTLGRQRFKLLVPTGNAACAIEGEMIRICVRVVAVSLRD